MHESTLAKRILETILARARDSAATRVRAVRGWIAESEALSPQSLDFHFSAHARGTPAEGARLELRLIHIEARCRACATKYAPEHHLLMCPSCGSTDGEELGQTGFYIEALEVD